MKHIHHIIPKHMGGLDDPENLIELSIEEHANAHKILFEEHGRWQDFVAWRGLLGLISSEERMRIMYDARKGSGNHMYGKPCYYKMTDEQKQQWRDNLSKGLKGRKLSDETKEKLRQANLGRKRDNPPWNKGKKTGPQSAELRRKKGKPLIYQDIEYNSIKEAERITGISAYKISKECVFLPN